MTLGQKLKELRETKGLSITDAANELGLANPTYRNYEKDRSKPRDAKTYEKIAEVYGVTVEELKSTDGASSAKKASRKSVRKKSAAKRAPAAPKKSASSSIDEQIAKKEMELEELRQKKAEADRQAMIEEYTDILELIADSGLTKAQVKKAIKDAVKAKKKPSKRMRKAKAAVKKVVKASEAKEEPQEQEAVEENTDESQPKYNYKGEVME